MSGNEKMEMKAAKEEATPEKPKMLFGTRHVQTLMLGSMLLIGYTLRVNMSVGIVAIVDNSSNPDFVQYDWDKKTQGLILSSFFWGYIVSQIPAGQLSAIYGPKYLLAITMLVNALFSLVTPIMAEVGDAWAVMACRVIQGICQGCFFPAIHNMVSKWIPPSERGRMATFIYSGSQFGTVIAMPLSGYLAESSVGWPSIFYLFGVVGVMWSVLWMFLGYNSPAQHPRITPEEKKYIESSLGVDPDEKRVPTPWLAIMTSLPMWALIVVHAGQNWGFWTLLTEMPTYMKNVLGFDIQKNGLYSALPYFAMWLLSFVFSAASDYVINRKILSVAAARKVANSIGNWIPAVTLIALGYVPADKQGLAVILLTITVGVNSATYVGFQVNHIDLAPRHAGTMIGITNAGANIMSILAPVAVGFIVSDETNDVVPWRVVFFIASAIYFLFNLFFVLFGKAEIQPWNDPEETKDIESQSPKYTSKDSENEVRT